MMGNFGKTIIVIFVWLAWFWVSPALAEGCEGWRNGQQDFWQNVNLEQVKTCLDKGADLTVYDDKYKATPLHWAASANADPSVTQALLDAGADINARARGRLTPLHVSAWMGKSPEVIMVLLRAGADGSLRSLWGSTAYRQAKNNEAINGSVAFEALKKAADKR
ncbi:MAG: ankyrin repeat domain-containing protein [Candidatus Halichondribacter symbioticus]